MKAILITIGTRGDIEPFVAIGERLTANGYDVLCVAPIQFEGLVSAAHLKFSPLSHEFVDLLESKDAKIVMGSTGQLLFKLPSLIRLAIKGWKINKRIGLQQYRAMEEFNPDLIFHHHKAVMPFVYNPNNAKRYIVAPVPYILHPDSSHSHLGFPDKIVGIPITRASYKIALWGLVKNINQTVKGIPNIRPSSKEIRASLLASRQLYTISPGLFSHLASGKSSVIGYPERTAGISTEQNPQVLAFIEKHAKVLLVTFGSMVNSRPETLTRLFIDIAEKYRIPTIINTANGGLIPLPNSSEFVIFSGYLNYASVFPKLYAVVHHGGSGTTHMSLKNGCATLIIPHIVDQFIWNKVVAEHRCGPLGVKIGKVNQVNLVKLITDLWNNRDYKVNAERIGKQITRESKAFTEELLSAIKD